MLLPTTDLSTAIVGTSGFVDFQPAGLTSDPHLTLKPPTCTIYNDTGSGLSIFFRTSGLTTAIPPGGWLLQQPVAPGEAGYDWKVIYQIPNPPATTLVTLVNLPGEQNAGGIVLGNSPIGGTTAMSTDASTLHNLEPAGSSGTGITVIAFQPNDLAYLTFVLTTAGFMELTTRTFESSAKVLLLINPGTVGVTHAAATFGETAYTNFGESTEAIAHQGTGGLQLGGTADFIKVWQAVTGTGNGVFNHNLGVTPRAVVIQPTANSTTPWSVGSYSTTQFTVAGLSAAILWRGWAVA